MPFLALMNTEEKAPPLLNDWASYLWYESFYWSVMAGLTYGFSLRTTGNHNIPKRGPALLIANHQSFLDPLAIGLAARRHLTYLARKTLFTSNKWFGKYLESVNCVPVDQEGVSTEGLKTSIDLLKRGKALLMFPEGERTLTGKMIPLKPGIHLIIKRAMVPVIPVGIAGAFDAYPRTAAFPKFSPLFLPATKATIAVSVGKPLDPERYAKMPREQALVELFDKIHEMEMKAERLRRKPH